MSPAPQPGGRLGALFRCVCDGARVIAGMGSYDAYVEHARRTHPDQAVMSYAEFFRMRQDARYGGGGGFRCC